MPPQQCGMGLPVVLILISICVVQTTDDTGRRFSLSRSRGQSFSAAASWDLNSASSNRRRFGTGVGRDAGSAAQQLYDETSLLSRFRSSSEQAQATAALLHARSMVAQGAGVSDPGTQAMAPVFQQCCRICDTEDDIGLGITTFLEQEIEEHMKGGKGGKAKARKTVQPDACNVSYINHQA